MTNRSSTARGAARAVIVLAVLAASASDRTRANDLRPLALATGTCSPR